MLQQLIANFVGGVRKDVLEGEDYLVAPMVMMCEGVHSGSQGSVYYPGEELAKVPQVWDHKPVVVYHPKKDGNHVSACSPEVLSTRKVGVILNTKWDAHAKKLRAESWMKEARLEAVDSRVSHAIANNKLVEVSTGLFSDTIKEKGIWNGEEYTAVARNYRPDHLAILPDQIGACSIADGAGLLQLNSTHERFLTLMERESILDILERNKSHDEIRRMLYAELEQGQTGPTDRWIEEVFDDHFIYSKEGKLFKQPYLILTDPVKASFVGDPTPVERSVEYRPSATVNTSRPNEDTEMQKKEMIDKLVTNKDSGWEEKDRVHLMTFNEDKLAKFVANAEPKKEEEKKVDPPADPPKPEQKKEDAAPANPPAPEQKKDDATPTANAAPVLSAQEYIKQAPPEIAHLLNAGLQTLEAKRAGCIKVIIANGKSGMTEDALKQLPAPVLESMAALAAGEQKPAAEQHPDANPGLGFFGVDFPTVVTANAETKKREPLRAPSTV